METGVGVSHVGPVCELRILAEPAQPVVVPELPVPVVPAVPVVGLVSPVVLVSGTP